MDVGRSHKSQRLAWTRGRLSRWLAGERADLWHDLPDYKRPQFKQISVDAAKKQRQERCIDLTSEGGFGRACQALVSPPPLNHTEEVTGLLADKHPPSAQPVDMRTFGSASSGLVPQTDVD